ncbi:MAG: gliding motility-associated C-terminal domain-containing protein [Chitinophagaceae bacterium]|nr:gliding motility-associated C-terminal domain-containing protein [Chitinophagaceae bacterium]
MNTLWDGTGTSDCGIATFTQDWTVETLLINGASNQYIDPNQTGGNYCIGMLATVQNDKLAMTFDSKGFNSILLSFDFSSIGVYGCGVPSSLTIPAMEISLYDSPSGTFSFTAPGSLLDIDTVLGIAPGITNYTFNWTNVSSTLNCQNSSNSFVTIVFDLISSPYAAFDNVSIFGYQDNVIISPDTVICGMDSTQILVSSNIDSNSIFWWSPTTYLSDSSVLEPLAFPPSLTTYFLNVYTFGCNLLDNGSFENGPYSFFSGLSFTSTYSSPGQYGIATNSQNWNPSLFYLNDHTTGTGNLMIVNEPINSNTIIWEDTVQSLLPNSNYILSFWLANLGGQNNSTITLEINGTQLGSNIQLSANTGQWLRYNFIWYTGNANSALISIKGSAGPMSPFFGIDDIYFSQTSFSSDSITIQNLPNPQISAAQLNSSCIGMPLNLQAAGAATFTWTPSTGLNNSTISNPTAILTTNQVYTITGTDTNGCTNQTTLNVVLDTLPVIYCFASDSSLCYGDSVSVFGSGGIGYLWSGGVNNGVYFVPAASATYTVIGTDANGCSNTSSINIIVNSSPNVVGNATPSSICLGSGTILNGSGAINYTWSGGVSNGINFYPSVTSVYTVTGIDANGCTASSTILIPVNPLPLVHAYATPNPVCLGSLVTLTGDGAVQYVWSGSVQNNTPFSPISSSTYTVYGTDTNGCSGWDTITVSLLPSPEISILPTDTTICYGDSVLLLADGASVYSWSPIQEIIPVNYNSVIAFPSTSHTFNVTGTDANGCSSSTLANIQVKPPLNIQLSKNRDADCVDQIVELQASGAQSYSWQPENNVNNGVNQIVYYNINETSLFKVTGLMDGCIGVDSIWVYYNPSIETGLFVPNAFTPDGDGRNDCFRVIHSHNFTKFYFTIYNRWGERVFESDNPDECWNGEFKGSPSEPQTYFYYLNAESFCGSIKTKGDILLLR